MIPVVVFLVWVLIAGFVAGAIWAFNEDGDTLDNSLGTLVAAFWPITLPFLIGAALAYLCFRNLGD